MAEDSLQDWLRDPDPGPGRQQVREATELARRLGVALLRVDADGVGAGELATVIAGLRVALEGVRDVPAIPEELTPAGPKEAPTFLSERSPVSGQANVGAPPLVLTHLPGRTRGVATFSELHEGPSGHVHGGVIAAMFDELLGVGQVHSGAAGYTVELDVRFHRITPLFEPIVYEATILDRDDTHVRVRGTSHREAAPDVELASAVGTFKVQRHLPIPDHLVSR